MAEKPRQENFEGQIEAEQTPEAILDALELAFEKGAIVELTVLQPSGELRTYPASIEGLEDGILSVARDKSSPVMPLRIGDVKKVSG